MVEADGVGYSYDALGRVANRQASAFTYSGLGAQPTGDGTTFIARSPSGDPVAAGDGTAQVHLLADRHGDVVGSFDESGLVDSIAYDPFGEILDRLGVSELMVGFQGHYTDPTTGLVDMGARWYQPSTGSFTSRDTYGGIPATPVSLNRYTYAHNNPLAFFDPDGHAPMLEGGYGSTTAMKYHQNAAKKSSNPKKDSPKTQQMAAAITAQAAAAMKQSALVVPGAPPGAIPAGTPVTSFSGYGQPPPAAKTASPKTALAATPTAPPASAPVIAGAPPNTIPPGTPTTDFTNYQIPKPASSPAGVGSGGGGGGSRTSVRASSAVGRFEPVRGAGAMRINLFIPNEKVCWAGYCIYGDGRGFDRNAGLAESRASIILNFEAGIATVGYNYSCNESRCEDAYSASVTNWSGYRAWPEWVDPPGRNGVAIHQTDGAMSLIIEGKVSAGLPGSPSINGQLDIEFGADGAVDVTRSGNEFPAYEAYQYSNGLTETVLESQARTHGYLIDGAPGVVFRALSTKDYWPW